MQSLEKQQPFIGPDHQIAAPVQPPPRHRRVLHLVLWLLLLLALILLGVVLVRRHENAEKAAALAERPAPGIAITTVTAKKGNIGVYLDAIGTVTPVYTAFDHQPGDRVNCRGALQGGSSGPEGRSAGGYRSAALPARRCCRRKGRWSETRTCSRRPRWIWSATAPPGRATPLPSRSWTTRKSSCCRTRARSKMTRERCSTTRCRSTTATSPRRSPAASVCGWWTRATWCSPPER